jgi:branched-chain amino acid transport system substrate-binding protein
MNNRKTNEKARKLWISITWIVLVALLLSGCGGIGPTTLKVVVSLPLSQEYAQDMLHATQLALKNANGKAGNVNVQILALSYSSPNGGDISADLAQQDAEQTVKDTSVVAFLGPDYTSLAKVSIPILNTASITQIASTVTWPGLTKPGYGPGEPGMYYPTGRRTFFRTVPSDEVQGAAGARWVVQRGYKSTYIVHGTGSYEQGVAGVYELTAKDLGINILGDDTFPIDGTIAPAQLETIVSRVIAAKPDVVYLAGNFGNNGEVVARALREANATLPIMVPDGLQVDDFINTLGANLANNIYGTTPSLPADKLNTPAAAAFLSSYQAAYGKKPSAFDTATYEAMNVLLYAIGQAKQPTRQGVLDAMQNLGDYSGVLGTWHFDEQGDISLAWISGMQVQNGAWVFVQALK